MINRLCAIVLFFGFCCSAQSPVYSLVEDGSGTISGAYYKDTYNDFDNYTGTWKYQQGNIVFEIVLQKKTQLFDPDFNNYTDILIGEYRYVDANGVETVNTLANLSLNLAPYENNIAGIIISSAMIDGYRKVILTFTDPDRPYLNRKIIVTRVPGTIPQKIKIQFTGDTSILPDENSPTQIRVQEQEYILLKQP